MPLVASKQMQPRTTMPIRTLETDHFLAATLEHETNAKPGHSNTIHRYSIPISSYNYDQTMIKLIEHKFHTQIAELK